MKWQTIKNESIEVAKKKESTNNIIEPKKITDERGSFIRNFCKNEFSEIRFNKEFVQSNLSFNKSKSEFFSISY
jgi:dTDP-4-dehydrorhamnose 3,5-epimerase-like enzyme